jgi:ribosomal protein L37E
MLNEYECSRCGVICRGHAAPWRCSECGSERVERRARPNWMQRAAKPVSVPGEGTKTEVEEGADAASVGAVVDVHQLIFAGDQGGDEDEG